MNNIKYIQESLFDDDIFKDNEKESISVSSKGARLAYLTNLGLILTKILGTDKPRAWKKSKDEDGFMTVEFYNDKILGWEPPKYVLNVIDELVQKGFTKYKQCPCPLCYLKGISVAEYEKKSQNHLWFIKQQDIDNWVHNVYPKLPSIVKDYFKDPECKEVVLSPDNGIVLLYFNNMYSKFAKYGYYNNKDSYHKAIIKLTNKVDYTEITHKEAKSILNDTKLNKLKISFLESKYKKYGSTHVIKEFNINDNGEPYGISYFNWQSNSKASGKAKKYKVPKLLIILLEKDFYLCNDIEKDDENATYELTKNGITFKFYKNVDCSKCTKFNSIDNKPDSYVICELEGYYLEQYHDLFDNRKR